MQTKCGECARPVRDIGGRDVNRMGETLRIHRDMALDAGYLLAGVIALVLSAVRVFHALRVDD